MKKIFLIFLIFMIPLIGQDITNKLGGTSSSETYSITDSDDKILFQVTGNGKVGVGTTSYDEKLHVNGGSIFWGLMDVRNSGGSTLFKVWESGKVGINTNNPDELFDVNGSMRVYGDFVLDDGFRDGNYEFGSAGQVLSSTGTATDWIDPPVSYVLSFGGDLDGGEEYPLANGLASSAPETDSFTEYYKIEHIVPTDGIIKKIAWNCLGDEFGTNPPNVGMWLYINSSVEDNMTITSTSGVADFNEPVNSGDKIYLMTINSGQPLNGTTFNVYITN